MPSTTYARNCDADGTGRAGARPRRTAGNRREPQRTAGNRGELLGTAANCWEPRRTAGDADDRRTGQGGNGPTNDNSPRRTQRTARSGRSYRHEPGLRMSDLGRLWRPEAVPLRSRPPAHASRPVEQSSASSASSAVQSSFSRCSSKLVGPLRFPLFPPFLRPQRSRLLRGCPRQRALRRSSQRPPRSPTLNCSTPSPDLTRRRSSLQAVPPATIDPAPSQPRCAPGCRRSMCGVVREA